MRPTPAKLPTERWVVVGTLRDGSPYTDEVNEWGLGQPKARAEYLAARYNAKGANLTVVHEVWNGPGVRWDRKK